MGGPSEAAVAGAPAVPTLPCEGSRAEHALRVGVAAVAVVAFASLWSDAPLLMGPEGLAPAAPLLARLRERGADFGVLPSLFWWWPPAESSLRLFAGLGTLGGALLASPRTAPWVALPLAFLYLSFANVGTTFYSFQWDNLVVETLVLVVVLGRRVGAIGLGLFWWLWFRLYVEGGLAKLLWSDDWTSGVAMGAYWQTAPLPAPLGWYAHQLPPDVQRALTWGTLVVEIAVPFLLIAGARARTALFLLFTGLQVSILLTANYGVFNYLSLVLGFSLLIPWPGWRSAWRGGWRSARDGLLASIVVPASMVVFVARFDRAEERFPELSRMLMRWRVANAYHLFAHVDPERDEVEVLGSVDRQTWTRFPWRYKPPEMPAFIAPYQPRVDFRLWFATLGSRDRPPGLVVEAPDFLERFIVIWCTEPERLEPLASGGPIEAPVYVTLGFRRLTFAEGAPGWTIEELGRHPVVYTCGEGAPRFGQVKRLVR